MKTTKIYFYLIVSLFLVSLGHYQLKAQTSLKSAYFVENNNLRHRLNPAFAPLHGYYSLPVIGSFKIQTEGNLGAKHYLFPLDNGKLGTFLHGDVTSSQFLDNFPKNAYLNVKADIDITNFGWYSPKSDMFWTVDWTLRASMNTTYPKELMEFLKLGSQGDPTEYNINNFAVGVNAYNQIAIGASKNISAVKGLRVGAKVKFLAGLAYSDLRINNINLKLGSDAWNISSSASGTIIGNAFDVSTDSDGYIDHLEIDPKKIGIIGYGLGFDIGATYTLSEGTVVDGLSASFSITDIGFISYDKNQIINAVSEEVDVNFKGFENLTFDKPGDVIKEQVDNITDELLDLASFTPQGATKNLVQSLNATIYAGLNYSFLKEDRMNVGILYSYEMNKYLPLHELTFSWGYMPKDWFNVTLSYSCLNIQESIGFMINLMPSGGLNFFIGADYISFSYTPQLIPIDHSHIGVHLGISVPIGKKMSRSVLRG